MQAARIELATACDEAYVPYVAVLARSIAASVPAPTRLTVLLRGVTHPARAALRRLCAGTQVELGLVEVDRARLAGLARPRAYLRLPTNYLRLLLPDVLDAARAIYLDADTLVRRDLTPLWRLPLEGRPVAAARDALATFAEAVANHERLAIPGPTPYFQSGVLLMDLERWRRERVGERARACCRRNRRFLDAQGRFPQHEQYGLNVVLRDRWRELPQTWNHPSWKRGDDPHVVHFFGDGKPWLATCEPRFAADFRARLAETPWARWRPGAGQMRSSEPCERA